MKKKVTIIIPAFNEEETVGIVLKNLFSARSSDFELLEVIVVDNASSDRTAEVAVENGARVVFEGDKGYGAACLKGISELGETDIVAFVDADGSDSASEWVDVVRPVVENKADLVIGSRILGKAERGALLPHQKFGNSLATSLLNFKYKTKLTDLGPFRAMSRKSLIDLNMQDRDFGWTIEMEVRALRKGYRVVEVPVSYKKRIAGESKVAGSLKGSFLAGYKILSYVLRDYFNKLN